MKTKSRRAMVSAALFLFLGTASALAGEALRWVGPNGQLLPFQTAEDVEEFLKAATIVSKKRVGSGINNPFKFLLEKDGVRAHAVFRDVRDPNGKYVNPATGVQVGTYRDDALFEIPAYRLGRHLGLNNIPPAVLRTVEGIEGSLQLWIEEAMTEKQRRDQGLEPENRPLWRFQIQTMRIFDNLIYNHDRNFGNFLYDPAWRLWMIDHTRAFESRETLRHPWQIWRCESSLWEKLRQLDRDNVTKAVAPFVSPAEIEAILKRRDLIVEMINKGISQRGEDRVLFRMPEIP